MLKIVEYIQTHPDWENELKQKPYCLSITRDGDFVLFKYNQVQSDFHNPIVREARGIILFIDGNIVGTACVPFFKFGNYGESYADEIDWRIARVQEKVDGSIIKVWHWDGEWRISTNGTIDAFKAPLSSNLMYNSFGELFLEACANCSLNFGSLDEGCVYMFELVSPHNRVVVPYDSTKIYHIGTRDMVTMEELDVNIGIQKPKTYPLQSLEDCIEVAKNFPFDQEGFVVVDGGWNRVKVKSPAYVAAHHVVNNHVITTALIIELIKTGEMDEFLNYYPEYKPVAMTVKGLMDDYIAYVETALAMLSLKDGLGHFPTKRDFALFVIKEYKKIQDVLFMWWDGKLYDNDVPSWLYSLSNEKIEQKIVE
jgi:hypothetical protein